jgi:hypothetical protein
MEQLQPAEADAGEQRLGGVQDGTFNANGGANFSATAIGWVGSWWQVIGAADLSGDGKDGLIFQGQDGSLWDWTMNGTQPTGGGSLRGFGAGWHLVA